MHMETTYFVIIIDHYFLSSKFQTWKFSTTTSCHHNLNWNFWIIIVKGLLLYIWIVKRLLEIMVHKFVHMCNFPTWPRGPSGSVGKLLSSWSKGCTFDPGLMREVVFSCNLKLHGLRYLAWGILIFGLIFLAQGYHIFPIQLTVKYSCSA